MGWQEAWAMDPIERRAIAYADAQFEGFEVDWYTGRLKERK